MCHPSSSYWLEVDDFLLVSLLFMCSSCLFSRASFARRASNFAYSEASARDFSPHLRFRASKWRLRCRRTGVMRRWIFGALNRCGLPSFCGSGRLMMYCRTSSSLLRLYSLRILPTRFGPSLRGMVVSVSPGISSSPFFTMTRLSTLRLLSTIQPRTDFRLR